MGHPMPPASINCSLQTPTDFTSPNTSALGAIGEIEPEFEVLSQLEPEYPGIYLYLPAKPLHGFLVFHFSS